MGLRKQSETNTVTVDTAVTHTVGEVLKPKKAESTGRDFEAETAGKIACVQYEAATMSPGLQMFAGQSIMDLHANIKKIAELNIKEVVRHQRTKEMFQ